MRCARCMCCPCYAADAARASWWLFLTGPSSCFGALFLPVAAWMSFTQHPWTRRPSGWCCDGGSETAQARKERLQRLLLSTAEKWSQARPGGGRPWLTAPAALLLPSPFRCVHVPTEPGTVQNLAMFLAALGFTCERGRAAAQVMRDASGRAVSGKSGFRGCVFMREHGKPGGSREEAEQGAGAGGSGER